MADITDSIKNTLDSGISALSTFAELGSEAFTRATQTAFGTTVPDAQLNQSKYNFSYLTFPDDLTNDYVGHYMVININVPVKTFGSGAGQPRGSFTNQFETLAGEFSKVDSLRFSTINNNVGGVNAGPLSIPRFTRRIAQSIALFMPTPVVHSTRNEYEDISMTALAGTIGTGFLQGGAALVGGLTGAIAGGAIGSIATGVGQAAGVVAGLLGYPINPRVEVLYSTTALKQYVFEFLMAPRNQKESDNLKNIVQTLRFHAAPELDPLTRGFTFIPPAEFDITFYDKGIENLNIPRINTCVLERIDVDYAPTGIYSTFKNGHPVSVRLSLGFREVEITHKQRILNGF